MPIPVFRSQPVDWGRAQEIHDEHGDSNQLSNFGPLVKRLEFQLAELLSVEADQLVIFSSGTEAISAAVATLPTKPEFLHLPDFSFLATLRAVQGLFCGSIEVEDSEPNDWSLKLVDEKSSAFLPVSVFGASPSYLLKKFSGKTAVIDAAASLGSTPDLSTLESNHAVCFSLHSTKILGSGEGGFAVFGEASWANKAREWSNFGRSSTDTFLASGANAKMPEVQAAFILAQLEQFPNQLQTWRKAQRIAREATERLGVEVHPQAFENPNPYWVVKFSDKNIRLEAEKLLKDSEIGFRSWWPISLAKLNSQTEFPISKELRETTLGLPMFLDITDEDISLVERALSPLSN